MTLLTGILQNIFYGCTILIGLYQSPPTSRFKAMTIKVFIERLYMGIVILLVKLFWKKPEKRCNLSWPADRLVIQVLDDSTDLVVMVIQKSLSTGMEITRCNYIG
ncbi:Beta-mannan synthase [Abeliophyllum distichum]|uniref:Beta-mannan synthase n=1 Tax=Abeliophyllum distichum TaxID=126358 RepID=A0ABD1VC59_9LAMI